MFSNKRIEELEDEIGRLEKKINVLEDDIRNLSNIYVYVGKDISLQFFAYTVPVKDIVAQLLDLHGLKIIREPATSERFTLAKREGMDTKEDGVMKVSTDWEGRGEERP